MRELLSNLDHFDAILTLAAVRIGHSKIGDEMTLPRQLAIPLAQSQIDAAAKFWFEGAWEAKEFEELKGAFADPAHAISIKAIVVNALYGTNIFAIDKVAACIERVVKSTRSAGPDLVEELVVEIRQITKRNNYSFASKYAHFFLDSTVPILDWYAEWTLGKHLGQLRSSNPKRYHKFFEEIDLLKDLAGIECQCAAMDAYLWVAGEYLHWKGNSTARINGDLKRQFERIHLDPTCDAALVSLLGSILAPPE